MVLWAVWRGRGQSRRVSEIMWLPSPMVVGKTVPALPFLIGPPKRVLDLLVYGHLPPGALPSRFLSAAVPDPPSTIWGVTCQPSPPRRQYVPGGRSAGFCVLLFHRRVVGHVAQHEVMSGLE
jgi:hypothetical protein